MFYRFYIYCYAYPYCTFILQIGLHSIFFPVWFVGVPFFTKALWQAINNLRKHIIQDCISDVDFISVHRKTGVGKDGLDRHHCARGTSRVENYHNPVKTILSGNTSSPEIGHAILVVHNYRHNIRMAVKHRGLPKQFGGFYNHYDIEALQEVTTELFGRPLFQGWLSTKGFRDTGERTGLVASVTAASSTTGNSGFQLGAFEEGLDMEDDQVLLGKLLHLTPSVMHYARMQGLTGQQVTPYAAVVTQSEKDKVAREWPNYVLAQVLR